MKKILITLLLCLPMMMANAQEMATPSLSETAYASLLTCGAGDEFYSTFGHTGIRICDTSQSIDVVYNYGMFSFNEPHFYWRFAKGPLHYWMGRTSYQGFMLEYALNGRAVWEQKLNISNQELNNLFLSLEWNNLPDNRYYDYDFFMDNCATRARDMINGCLTHRTAIVEDRNEENPSFRDLVYKSTEESLLWWRFGIDILLGMRCDKPASNVEQMFSPLEMMTQFDTVKLSDSHEPLVKEKTQLLEETREPLAKSISPTLIFWLVFSLVMLLTLIAWIKGWKLVWLDVILFGVVGLISLLIIFLWIFSTHYCTKANLNILWCSPFFLYFAIMHRKSNIVVLLFQILALLTVLIGFWWLPQTFNAAIFPIALTLLIRLIDKFKIIKR